MQDRKTVGAIILLAILLISLVYYFRADIFGLTLLSAQTININQQGGLEGNKLTGTYWSIVMAVDFTDQVGMYTFNDAEAHKPGASPYWQGENLTVQNSVMLWIDPGRPYYERPLQLKSCQLAPEARQNWISFGAAGRDDVNEASSKSSGHWETVTSDWILHTPFTVKVYVNNWLVGTQHIDTIGAVDTTNIGLGESVTVNDETVDKYLTITNLGALQTGYTIPIWQDVVWWNNQYFYENSEAVRKAIHNPYPLGDGITTVTGTLTQDAPFTGWKDSYAWYWYGYEDPTYGLFDYYWKDTGEPCPYKYFPPTSPYWGYNIMGRRAPGWSEGPDDILYRRASPWTATSGNSIPIFPTSAKPPGSLSLVEFLEQKAFAKKPLMPSWEPNANNIEFVTTDDQNGFLRLYCPWGSFTRLIDVRISAELADTIIWEPQVANIKIVNCPSDIGEIGERKSVSLTLGQDSTVASSGTVTISPITSGLYLDFEPETFGTGTMNPGDTKTFSFDVVNLGQPTRTDFQFKVEVKNSLGQITDSKTVTGTLLPRTPQGSILLVRTIDKKTRLNVNGIHVIVNYDTMSKDGWTSSGTVSFDFGGGTPTVTISTTETLVYKSATMIKQLAQGQNEVTFELEEIGTEEEDNYWLWILIGVIVAAAVVAIALVVWKKKK